MFTSVDGAERGSGVPHFESKWRTENRLEELGIPTTVLRPTFFIDNYIEQGPVLVDGTLVLRTPLRPDKPLQMIATADIGVFAAVASSPGRRSLRRIEPGPGGSPRQAR